jgi:hypothetical protein
VVRLYCARCHSSPRVIHGHTGGAEYLGFVLDRHAVLASPLIMARAVEVCVDYRPEPRHRNLKNDIANGLEVMRTTASLSAQPPMARKGVGPERDCCLRRG